MLDALGKQRICLVTVCNNHNCGSHLQAYALEQVLLQMGAQVSTMSIPRFDEGSAYYAKRLLKGFLKRDVALTRMAVAERSSFSTHIHRPGLIDFAEVDESTFDAIVIGSDTIWDSNKPYYARSRDFYWGTAFSPDVRKVVYAGSFGDTHLSDVDAGFAREALCQLHAVSARDLPSLEMLENLGAESASLVCDPVMLLGIEKLDALIERMCGRQGPSGRALVIDWDGAESLFSGAGVVREGDADTDASSGYLLVYAYRRLSQDLAQEISTFARERGVEVVGLGLRDKRLPWKATVSQDLATFSLLFRNARYVVTDAFHGSILSILHHRPFVVVSEGKRKVDDLLFRTGLSGRAVMPGDVRKVLDVPVDWSVVDKHVDQMRAVSMSFLEQALVVEKKAPGVGLGGVDK